MAKLIVTSALPGRPRAGEIFTGATEFPPDHFTAAQLKAIAADPMLTLVVGDVLKTEAEIHAHLKSAAAGAKGGATK